MSLKSKMAQMFNGHIETSETHSDEQFQTRYYKTTKDRMMKELSGILKSLKGYDVIAEYPERGEISVTIEGQRTYFLVITIIMVRPFRTAVDFSVTAKRGIDIGFGRKVILQTYERIGKSFEYIGKGLSERA